ncbi:AAA family ATPase [Streptomyces sp. NPDC057403]|uniref:nSTAND1 domain-containing NTPase n=1 Tax=Streptomyces sp. NPDC057403 TaxID=3346119 RepID=UPI0036A717B4
MGRIFISYHASDGGIIARRLVEGLEAAGFQDCYAYDLAEHGPVASSVWRHDLRRNLLAAEALFVVTTPSSKAAEWCAWEVSIFPERKPKAPILEFVSGVEMGSALLNEHQTLPVQTDNPKSLDLVVREALRVLEEHGVSKAPGLTSPFPGLRAFEEEHASVFFGRKRDVEQLVRPMLGSRRSGSLAVVGPSGAGKSSLVRAGLVPYLRRRPTVTGGARPQWTVLGPLRPADGIDALASAIAEIRGDLMLGTSTILEVQSRITAAPEELDVLLSDIVESTAGSRLVIVLDQAEELLWESEETKALVAGLISATRSKAWLVYTVRADLLDALMSEETLAPLVADDFLVKPLGQADLPLIINGPLDRLGWRMSDEALGQMVVDATDETLPLLAFALERLWRHVNPDGRRNPRTINLRDYTDAGRVQDVLRDQAEEAFAIARDSVPGIGTRLSWDEAGRAVLRTLRRLVSVDAAGRYTRRTVPVSDLPQDEARLLKPFVDCRVVIAVQSAVRAREDSDSDITHHTQDSLQVAHESLFLHWPRLQEILAQERDALRARQEIEDLATAWEESGHPQDQTIPPTRLMKLLTVLSPLLAPMLVADNAIRTFTHGWPHLSEKLTSLQLSVTAVTLMKKSLQRNLDDEVSRALAMAANPRLALCMLAGAASAQGDDMLTMLLHASDTTAWERALRRVMGDLCLIRTLTGHEEGIWGVAWSPDDNKVATGSKDGSVRVWDVDSGNCLARFDHGMERRGDNIGWVRSVAWSPHGDLIASVGTDEKIRLWSLADNREVDAIHLPNRPWSVRFDSTGQHVLVACADGNAYLHSVRGLSQEPVRVFASVDAEGSPVRLWDADLSADGELVACARDDGEVDLHRLDGSSADMPPLFWRSDGSKPTVRSARFSPDGRLLATGDQANNVLIRHMHGGAVHLKGHRDQVRRVSWSPAGFRLATASADESVRIWNTNAADTATLLTLAQHEQGVCDVAWSHQGDTLATVSDDGKVRIWKTGPEPQAEMFMQSEKLTTIAWCGQTRRLVIGSQTARATDEPVIVGINSQLDDITAYQLNAPGLASLAWSPDGTRLLAGSLDGTVSILTIPENEAEGSAESRSSEPRLLTDAYDGVHDAQWSNDGAYIAVVSRDRTWLPRLYDQKGRRLETGRGWTTHRSFLRAVAWHPRHTLFAVAGQDNMVTLNTLERTVARWRTEKVFTSLAWSPCGDRLAVGCTDGTVIILDTRRLERDAPLEDLRLVGHTGGVNSIAWSADGKTLLTASDDGSAQTWHAGNGGRFTIARASNSPVVRALWIDDRHHILTASAAGLVQLWDLSDGPARPLSAMESDLHTLIMEARLRSS